MLAIMSGTTTITAGSSLSQLPDDVSTLKQMVLTLLGQIDDLSGQLQYLKRQLFGRKSEKLNPHQRLLFENLYEQVQAKLEQQQEASKPQSAPSRRNATHAGRRPLPAELPRQIIPIEPAEDDKVCEMCHAPKQRIGEEVTEKLDYAPASFFVKRYVRPKYACKRCEGQIAVAPLPPMPVDKGVAGEGLLSHIITGKYADHNPLNRLEGILRRHGVDIPVSTLCDWVGQCADLLAPLPQRLHQIILSSPKLNTDDTTIPVQCRHRKGSTYNGYLWVYIDDCRHVVFDFTPTRSREGPIRFLGGYAGYVQADAYSGYDEFFRTSKATEVGCHAHARRKFEHALESDPVRAARFLALWGKLYDGERTAREEKYTAAQLLHARQTLAQPVLAEIHTRLKEYQPQVLPQSPTGKAITYSLNQWEALLRYTSDPILAIDNNLAERMLRMVVIGRKNYLFAGSETGARRAAVLYSLVATCKLNAVDPFVYFRDVLGRISTHPASRIDELLPGEWKKSHPETLTASPAHPVPASA
jgi:transposase